MSGYSQALISVGPEPRAGTRPGSASVARPGSSEQLVQLTSSVSSAPPKRPSVSDFLSLGSSLTSAPAAAAAVAAPAAVQRKATATDFVSALDGISIAPSPTIKVTRPATADSATLSALAALRGYSENYSLPARDSAIGGKGRLKNPKVKLMAARASADQLLIDRVATAEAKVEQAALSAQKASRQLATLRAKVARIEEERDQARDCVSIAQDESSQLRADNVAMHAKVTQRLAVWEVEREELQAEIARLRAQLTQQEKRVSERLGSVPSWERDHNSRAATEYEAEQRQRARQRELAPAMQEAERGRQARGELPPASAARGVEPSSRASASEFLSSVGGASAGFSASADVGVCISPDSRGRQRLALSLAGEGPARPLNSTTDAPPRRSRVRLNFLGDNCVASIGLEARAPAAPDAAARPSAAAAADAAAFLAESSVQRPSDAASFLAGSSAARSSAAAFLDDGFTRPNDAAAFLAVSSSARPSSTSAASSSVTRPSEAACLLAGSSVARSSAAAGSSAARLESRLGLDSRPGVAPSRLALASSPPAVNRSAIDLLVASSPAPRVEPGVERSSGVAPSSGGSSAAAFLSATSPRQAQPTTTTSALRPASSLTPQPSSASGFLNAISDNHLLSESGTGRASDFAKPIPARSVIGVGAR